MVFSFVCEIENRLLLRSTNMETSDKNINESNNPIELNSEEEEEEVVDDEFADKDYEISNEDLRTEKNDRNLETGKKVRNK